MISKGIPSQIIYDLVFGKLISVCLSEPTLGEYIEVFNREKFTKYPDFKIQAEIVLLKMQELGVFFYPTQQIEIIKDVPDNRFLELAIESNADFLITGNTKDFDFDQIGITKIVSPKDYWEFCKPEF
ncbi:MAG: putative toxin-antitoxin system toxin component, PIN family [Saprospiraceae bacterium]|nr:putative toxin-antitoxin system toxin component, PIN family [Saprospiraceae bacterium]